VTQLLVDDLKWMEAQWSPSQCQCSNYPSELLAESTDEGLRKMLYGMDSLSASATQWLDCKGYIGSVMTNKHSVIATSPVGNQMLEFDRGTLAIKRVIQIPDVCGVATNETQGFVSTGFGNVEQIQRGVMRTVYHSALKWDNHLIRV
jgi:hypothetical protein